MEWYKNKYVMIVLIILFIVLCLLIFSYSKKKKDVMVSHLNYVKYADDITKMNKTNVDNVFNVLSTEDIIHVIKLAKTNNKRVIARGEMHSMGGQTIAQNGYILDTKFMNHILEFNSDAETVVVEPGVTWYNLIHFLNLYGYSPKILQSYASFSIGGSVSVNIHGITSDDVLSKSIIELEIINSDGDIIMCNRQQNSELFFLVIGGYGLFGVITKIKISITENKSLNLTTLSTNIQDFQNLYSNYITNAVYIQKINVKFARINITNMEDINIYLFTTNGNTIKKSNIELDNAPKEMSKISQLIYKWILPNENAQKIRFQLETKLGKPLDIDDNEEITRNELLYESAKSLSTLYSPLIDINKTHILQEYFIPSVNPNNFTNFMTYLKDVFIVNKNKITNVNLLNITIRYVLHDNETFLNYTKRNMYAFVFYYRIDCNKSGDTRLRYIHNLLVNKTLELGGTFYLPYRHHYDQKQLEIAYPQINQFFELKKRYDQTEMFYNNWYGIYRPKTLSNLNKLNLNNNILIKQDYNVEESHKIILNLNSNNYDYIISSKIWSNKLKTFLINIFDMVSPLELYDFICSTHSLNKIIDDTTMFMKIKEYTTDKYSKLSIAYKSYILTNKQQDIVSSCIKELLLKNGINYPLNNYVSFGDSGRYISTLKEDLNITGKIYVVNDNYNYLEQSTVSIKSTFIQYDYNLMDKLHIQNNTIELVTCLIGLHHFNPNKLNSFLKNVYDTLKPNGFFILREHNAKNNIIPLLNVAHSIFNAVTGESASTEKIEIRNFQNIMIWRQIIESIGFKDTRIYTIQDNDPTDNLFMCFIKPDPTNGFVPLNLKSICYQNETYKRALCQSYLTVPEWFSVDIVKSYGNFLEHTPWYDYPYGQIIMKYWSLVLHGINTSITKCGIGETIHAWSYTFMNCIIGILLTGVFTQLGILAVIPSFFYHLPGNDTPNTIQMIIKKSTLNTVNFKMIDKRIKLINSEGEYYIIETPRYKQLMNIIFKLLLNHIKIIEIAGQNEIQIRIKTQNKNQFVEMDGIEILYDYSMFDDNNKEIILNVKLDKIMELLKQNIKIEHIYDY